MRERIKRFTRILTLPSAHECIGWWEKRRLLYNLIVLPCFAVTTTLSLMLAGRTLSDVITRPGLALSIVSVLFFLSSNFGYTLGWVSELLWSGGQASITRPYRQLIFRIGIAVTILVCFVPFAGVVFLSLFAAA